MDNQTRIPAPNYTQIPNAILDLMAEMEETEFRVVMAIARQTFGWHKKRDKISLSQLEKLTGLSRQGVVNGIAAGEQRGLIEKTKDESDKRGGIWYRLLVNSIDQSTELTSQPVDQSTQLTRTSQLNGLELVNSVDTQKKDKEKKERVLDEVSRALFDLCLVDPDLAPPPVLAQLRKTYKSLRDKEVTQVDIRERFAAYWYSDDNWMARKAREQGRNPEPPTPEQVLADWTKAMAWKPAKRKARAIETPDIAPAQPRRSGADIREALKRLEAGK